MALVNDFSARINQGWDLIKQNALTKIENYLLTGNASLMFTKKEYMTYYTYDLSYQFIFVVLFMI